MVVADEAAVDDVGGAGDVGGFVGGEEGGEAGYFFGCAEAAERDVGEEGVELGLVCPGGLVLMGVAMAPGAMLLTVMPRGPSSTARLRMSMRMPPLEAQ